MNYSRYAAIPTAMLVLAVLITGCGRPRPGGTTNGGGNSAHSSTQTTNDAGNPTHSSDQPVIKQPVPPLRQTSNSSLKILGASLAKNASGLYDVNITVRNDGALPAAKFDFECEYDCPYGDVTGGLKHAGPGISISQGIDEIPPHSEKHFVGVVAFSHCTSEPAVLNVDVEVVDRVVKKIVAKTNVQVSTK